MVKGVKMIQTMCYVNSKRVILLKEESVYFLLHTKELNLKIVSWMMCFTLGALQVIIKQFCNVISFVFV